MFRPNLGLEILLWCLQLRFSLFKKEEIRRLFYLGFFYFGFGIVKLVIRLFDGFVES